MGNKLSKLNFSRKQLVQFLLIVSNSQLVYAFIAIRSVLYDPFLEALGVNNTQFGVLMGFIGLITTFGNIAFGWVQDRFSTRKVLAVNSFVYGILALFVAVMPQSPFFILTVVFIGFGFTGDALYWASVLKSVRNIAPETKQATAFGIMEFIRGGWEFITNALAVAVYTWLGYTIFGMKVAMGINAGLTILSALTIWFFVPEENLLQTNVSREKTRLAFKGFLQVLRMPAVWMTGLAASCVYATFAAVNTYFVPYLKNVYLLPIAWVSIFGLINGSFTRLTAGPIAGFISDSAFKSSAHLMKLCYAILTVLLSVALLLPKQASVFIPAAIVLILVSITCFLIRGVYYSPIGEMGVPKEMGAAAMSVASFIGYSPSFWAYPIYGAVIDKFPSEKAYSIIFIILIGLAILGFTLNFFLGKKILEQRESNKAGV